MQAEGLFEADGPTVTPVCQMLVVYEDTATRDHAALTCMHLADSLAAEVRVEMSWWRADFLIDPRIAWEATEAALDADIIIFALHAGHEIPPVLRHWSESWSDARGPRPGAIVGLIGITASPEGWHSRRHEFLQHLAEEARMDYLPQGRVVSEETAAAVNPPDSTAGGKKLGAAKSAGGAASLPEPTSHWGLNE